MEKSKNVRESRNIKAIFTEEANTNDHIREAFNDLSRWKGKPFQFVKYEGFVVKGYLIKEARTKKFFNQYMLRFFLIDFEKATVTIKHKENDTDMKNWHQMPFRDIISCHRLDPNEEMEVSKKVKHDLRIPFILKTN